MGGDDSTPSSRGPAYSNIQITITGGLSDVWRFEKELVKMLSHAGAVIDLTNATPETFARLEENPPPRDSMILYEETTPHILMKDADQRDLRGGNTDWKDRMTSGVTGGLYFYNDPVTGRRMTGTHNSGLVLTNQDVKDNREHPIISRMITVRKSEVSSADPTEMAPK